MCCCNRQAMDRLMRPRSVVKLEHADGIGEVRYPVCGDSTCTLDSLKPPNELLAMDSPHEIADGSLGLMLGNSNTKRESGSVFELLSPIIEKLRTISPFK